MQNRSGQIEFDTGSAESEDKTPEPSALSEAAGDRTILSIETEERLQEQDKTVITQAGSEPSRQENARNAEPQLSLFADKYIILEKLGTGGMSTVYKVKHKILEKTYALKLLHDLKQDSILRFEQEAKAATLLKHPNLVGVVDFGISDGIPYMLMDFVDGATFSSFVKSKKPKTAELSRLFGEICLALAHAHEKGVIHRDIKPSNIVITSDSAGLEHAVVVDFGIAKILDDNAGSKSNLTRTGDIFGTPLYMSPEQCQGAAIVDARSDIYSLACVMYELIAGRPPFQGDNSYQIIHQHISSAPAEFSAELRKSKETRMLEAIILKAMAKDPADRFQYILQISSALKEVELCSNETQIDPLFQLKLALSRLKASDKESVMRRVGLQAGTALSTCIALILFLFPQQIENTQDTIATETQIIDSAKALFGNAVASDENVFHLRPSQKKNILKQLRKLCSYDAKTARDCRRLTEKSLLAINKLDGIMDFKRSIVSGGMNLDLLSSMSKMEAHLTKGMTLWCQANAEAVDLANSVSARRELNRNKLATLNFVYYFALSLAMPILLGLAALLKSSWKQRKNPGQTQQEKSGP